MSSEAKKFSITQICRIIQVCKKNEVSEFNLGELRISFKSEGKLDLPKAKNIFPASQKATDHQEIFAPEIQKEFEETQMLIDDPVAFEQEQIDATLYGDIAGERRQQEA